MNLSEEVAFLRQEVARLRQVIPEQNWMIADLRKIVEEQKTVIADLRKQLHEHENKKNSSNSSTPPSQDPFRPKKTSSLRERSGKKPGGQPGHEGTTLEMVSSPDEVVEHTPGYCSVCGGDLSGVEAHLEGRRQSIDIPPVLPVVTEHRIYSKRCSCGHCQKGAYPAVVHSPVCYGPNVVALTSCLHARQYMPYDRMREFFADAFGLEISRGSLVNMVSGMARKSEPVYQEILERLGKSGVAGADETGVCVNGKNHWAWVFQSKALTYIFIHASRGKKAVEEVFRGRFLGSILVSDCWPTYFAQDVAGHQLCTAHLLRELKYLSALYRNPWAGSFTNLLLDALQLKKTLAPADYSSSIVQRPKLEERLNLLLQEQLDPEHEKLVAFRNRIVKYRAHLFKFLYHCDVPPDNNGSERAVRTFKVKQKVSGLFRSSQGAQDFAILRSVIDTTLKNGQNVLNALKVIASEGVLQGI